MTIIKSASVAGMEDHPTGIGALDERIPFPLNRTVPCETFCVHGYLPASLSLG
ncbi:MAG: hypothetical protein JWR32_6337 [Mycobacterium sp.]|jgi:hypothetical protein|nr:hypothetical protein [Mycobacterium sp.]